MPPTTRAVKSNKPNTNSVSAGLITSIKTRVPTSMSGERTSVSSTLRMLHSTSCTSAVARASRSPLRSSL